MVMGDENAPLLPSFLVRLPGSSDDRLVVVHEEIEPGDVDETPSSPPARRRDHWEGGPGEEDVKPWDYQCPNCGTTWPRDRFGEGGCLNLLCSWYSGKSEQWEVAPSHEISGRHRLTKCEACDDILNWRDSSSPRYRSRPRPGGENRGDE